MGTHNQDVEAQMKCGETFGNEKFDPGMAPRLTVPEPSLGHGGMYAPALIHSSYGKRRKVEAVASPEDKLPDDKVKASGELMYVTVHRPYQMALSERLRRHCTATHADSNLMPLERWKAELTVDAPYHAIGAVGSLKTSERRNVGDEVSAADQALSEVAVSEAAATRNAESQPRH